MVETVSMSVYSSALALLLASTMSRPYPPIDVVTGFDSNVETKSIILATTPQDWENQWQRHKGITPIGNTANSNFPSLEKAPTVDFDHNVVLVLFGGLAAQGGYEIVDSVKTAKEVDVRIRPLSLSPNGGRTPAAFKANPFMFAIYKKTKLPFAIQVQQADQSGTVTWQTVGRAGGTD